MRSSFSDRVERARVRTGDFASNTGDTFGMFELTTNARQPIRVMVSDGRDEDGVPYAHVPWEHVSVSTRTRCPTWDEMCWVKSLFFGDDELVMQVHPPSSEYVNQHAYCLHLWRPLLAEIPKPPSIAVGLKDGPVLVAGRTA